MTMGAWAYQIPAEPARPYPIDVWYRIPFQVDVVPSELDLIVDGFAGAGWEVFVNGQAATDAPVRSRIDSQMQALDISGLVQQGRNVIAVRLTVTKPTDGLLDLVKLVGNFAVLRTEGGDRVGAPVSSVRPASWTEQGYPYYAGRGLYRFRFVLPEEYVGQMLMLEPAVQDDAVEVIVNGQKAGVRLWSPYEVEITEHLRPDENVLELRVANTLINLLEAVERPSGLTGPPRLVPYRSVLFSVSSGTANDARTSRDPSVARGAV